MERRGGIPVLMMDEMWGVKGEGGVKADSEVSCLGDWVDNDTVT